jgi:hypothetical protein
MPKLLERSIRSVDERLVLLAPSNVAVPHVFQRVETDWSEHRERLREVQRLRGDIYFTDGAVQRQDLSADGLHQTPEDEKSWHLAMIGKEGEVTACVWYLAHSNTTSPTKLRSAHSPAGRRRESCEVFWKALNLELSRAREHGLGYVEIGGWAVTKESRCTSEGLVLALAAYGLGRILGGALGVTTATVRHSSSTILRHLGGSRLEADGVEVAPYFDPKYQCEMELLRFDSRRPNAKYADLIELLKEKLADALVIGRRVEDAELPRAASPYNTSAQIVAA